MNLIYFLKILQASLLPVLTCYSDYSRFPMRLHAFGGWKLGEVGMMSYEKDASKMEKLAVEKNQEPWGATESL